MARLLTLYKQLLQEQRRNIQLPAGPSAEERTTSKKEDELSHIQRYVKNGSKGFLELDSFLALKAFPPILKRVGGDLAMFGSALESLGDLEEVQGHIFWMPNDYEDVEDDEELDCQISDLGQLKKVGGDALFQTWPIKTLGRLQEVGGELSVESCEELVSLGDLKKVGKTINIRNTPLADLGIPQLERKYPQFKGKFVVR